MQFHRENNKQIKKPQELVWKFNEKHMKIHGTKVHWPATEEDKRFVSPWLRSHSPSHSPIDNCGLSIRHEEYKSQATRLQTMHPFTTAIEASVKLLFSNAQRNQKVFRACLKPWTLDTPDSFRESVPQWGANKCEKALSPWVSHFVLGTFNSQLALDLKL